MSRKPELANRVATALAELLIPPVALHEPLIEDGEIEAVVRCLRSGWVSTAGPFVADFEAELARYTGASFAIATSSGTAALHIALLLAGVNAGDEVLIPSLSFVATANAVTYCGAIPHFVDVDEHSLGMSPTKLAEHLEAHVELVAGSARNRVTGRPVRAIVPMHTFGHPVEIELLKSIAEQYRIALVEDAAESLGSFSRGIHTGRTGLLAALSFNGNKIATTGGGGAILTDDPLLAKRAKHLTTTAKVAHEWKLEHDEVGYNYRLPNLNAALGLAQMARLEDSVERKRDLLPVYQSVLAPLNAGRLFTEREGVRSNYWLHCFLLEGDEGILEATLSACHAREIFVRPAWTPLHQLAMYREAPRAVLTTTEDLCRRILCLPSGAGVASRLRLSS